jgi:2-polyprenyl-6-methoxyphenol hydroxylase-like FAD-dependent oxidoreductase
VVLVGDAIHPMTPDLAQGHADATTLAACLAASRHPSAALPAYQRRRWRNAAANTLIAPRSVQLRQLDLVLDLKTAPDSVPAWPIQQPTRCAGSGSGSPRWPKTG